MLTRRQADTAQAAAWLRLATDPRAEYLSVALAGLQRLPNQGDAHYNQALMLLALLRHAALQPSGKEAQAFFNRRFAALRGLYPAGPQHWQGLLEEAGKAFQPEAKHRTAKELLQRLREEPKPKTRKPPGRDQTVQPADKNGFDQLFNDIRSPGQQGERLAERLFTLLEQNYRYAEATGDSHLFVLTLSKHGTNLLKRHALAPETLRRFHGMIERALLWEPMNPFVWMFWATVLAHQQHTAAQEWVLRETARLFPGDEPSRVELARLLIWRGEDRWDEAEAWLREAVERSPRHEPSRVVLAKLWARQGKRSEAVELLKDFLSRNPQNPIARGLLERFQAGADVVFESEDSDEETRIPYHSHAPGGNASSDVQRPEPQGGQEGASTPNLGAIQTDSSGIPAGMAEPQAGEPRLFAELKRRAGLQTEFNRAQLADASGMIATTENIDDAAAQGDALAGLFLQWLRPDDALEPPPHAWAWRACRLFQHAAPADEWKQLEQTCPEHRMETRFLRLLTHLETSEREEESRRWKQRVTEDDGGQALTPLERFMLEALDHPPSQDAALAVLASAAVGAPRFAMQ